MGKFLGVYDYTVILTYLSLISSLLGMTQAFSGHYTAAVICLGISGLCDAFDGRVARSKKNRTEDDKAFGIQLDSLCDVICFGAFPAMLCYNMGMNGIVGMVVACFYTICAVIRLAFFNVLEGKPQEPQENKQKVYHGLPVTSIAFILPLCYLLNFAVGIESVTFKIFLHVLMTAVGFLFILDFPLRKPSLKTLLILIAIAALIFGGVFLLVL